MKFLNSALDLGFRSFSAARGALFDYVSIKMQSSLRFFGKNNPAMPYAAFINMIKALKYMHSVGAN